MNSVISYKNFFGIDTVDHCALQFTLQAKFESETQEVAGSQFSVSQQESSAAKTSLLENALDIKVNVQTVFCTVI